MLRTSVAWRKRSPRIRQTNKEFRFFRQSSSLPAGGPSRIPSLRKNLEALAQKKTDSDNKNLNQKITSYFSHLPRPAVSPLFPHDRTQPSSSSPFARPRTWGTATSSNGVNSINQRIAGRGIPQATAQANAKPSSSSNSNANANAPDVMDQMRSRLAQIVQNRPNQQPASKVEDPIAALRRKFTGKSDQPASLSSTLPLFNRRQPTTPQRQPGGSAFQPQRAGTQQQQSSQGLQFQSKRERELYHQRQQQPNQANNGTITSYRPPQRNKPSPFTGTSSEMLDLPLTQIIKNMQLNNSMSQKMKQEEEAESFDMMNPAVIPKWRQPNNSNNLRDQRKQREPRLKSTVPERHKPVYSDPKQQTVILPNFQISLTEASLLFRTKTATLIDLLTGMGEGKTGVDDESWMLSTETLELLAMELGLPFEISAQKSVVRNDEALMLQRRAAAEQQPAEATAETEAVPAYESYASRPPVVCIMGHVDHGKTTLMDALRRRAAAAGSDSKKNKKKEGKKKEKGKKGAKHAGDVAGTEAGGITQVISAFQVPLEHDDSTATAVTFLDTPGHAAFTAMRQSGSDAADIIVLVVAADDGVSEQTIEILNFYKSIVKGAGGGGISLVVAMNKIDKPGIDVEESTMLIQSQLLEHGILTEGMPSQTEGEYGPPVQMIPVSGLTGQGLDDLIDGLVLQSEVMDLRADAEARAEGIVMDARVDKGVGIVADCIIRWGTIKKGDIVVSGTNKGKVRLLKDVANMQLKQGVPSQPVRIIGFDTVPKAGDPIVCVESEEVADNLVARRKASTDVSNVDSLSSAVTGPALELQSAGRHMMTHAWKEALEKKYGMDQTDEKAENAPIRIPVVIKADADGTLAAIRDALLQIGDKSAHNIVIEPVKLGVGPLLATEVQIAKECNATIVCFNLKNEQVITNLADENDVPLLRSDVIYSLLDGAKIEFANYLSPEPIEVVHGRGKVQAVYEIGGMAEKVAGLQVTEGTLFKDKVKGGDGKLQCQYRVLRGGKLIVDRQLKATSLKHFKDDVDEVARGKECGISLTGHDDYEKGDEIECFSIEMRRPSI